MTPVPLDRVTAEASGRQLHPSGPGLIHLRIAAAGRDELVVGAGFHDAAGAALVERTGPAGEILRSVVDYEQGEFLSSGLGSLLLENPAAYRDSLAWARRAVCGMA